MQLNSFGTILGFAEEMEKKDQGFYQSALNNQQCSAQKGLFEQISGTNQKNIKVIQRTRRENVTEMILEGISDFSSETYEVEPADPGDMTVDEVLDQAMILEKRAENYYLDAADKIKALPEVGRALKMLAKKRIANQKLLK